MTTEDTVREVIAKVGLWWPAADEDKLRAAATAYRAFATDIDGLAQRANTAATAVTTANQAASVDQFRTLWQNYDGSYQGYLPGLASGARAMASACEQFADAVVEAKNKIRELAITIGATLVVGTVLAFFTFGIAEGAALATSAALVSAGAAVGVTLSETAALIVATALVGAVFGAVEGAAVDVAVAQPIRVYGFHDGGFSLSELQSSFEFGGAGGFVFGGAGAGWRVWRNVPFGTTSDLGAAVRARAAARDPRLPVGEYDPIGGLTPGEFRNRFWDPAANGGNGGWRYPPNGGAVPGTEVVTTMKPGRFLDRFGPPDGRYLSPEGADFPGRALPPDSLGHPADGYAYHRYEVLKPFPVETAKVARAFGQPGGAVQHKVLPMPGQSRVNVQWLLDHGYLREVSP